MGFVKVDISDEIEKETNPEFAGVWASTREEYRLIDEMVSIRKESEVTQGKLAEITGIKQQVISRIENKEHGTSLGTFCRLLSALGYKLEIVKRED